MRAAEVVYQASDPANPIRHAWTRYTLGWVFLRRIEVVQAQPLLREAQATFERMDQVLPTLHCRRALLLASTLAGADLRIQQDWDALCAAYEASQALLEAARTRIQQAAHLNALGRYAEARACITQAQPLLTIQGTLDDLARLCRVTAITASYLDDYSYALDQLDAAASYFARLDYPLDVAKCRLERGTLLMRQEHYTAALDELAHAQTIFIQLDDQIQIAVCEKTLGLVWSRLGRFDQAIALTVAAQRRFRLLNRHDHVAACDLNLGNIAYYSGRFELARAAYCRAQQVFERLGIQHDALLAQRNQALVMRAQSRPAAALEQLLLLEGDVVAHSTSVELANIYQAQAEALTDLGHYDAALDRLERAQAIFAGIGKPLMGAQCLLEQGWIALAQGQIDDAVAAFITAQPALVQRPIHLWRVFYGLGRCAAAAGDRVIALAHYVRASTLVADLRATLQSEHLSSGLFQQAQQFFCAAIQLAVAQRDLETVLLFVEQQHALVLHQSLSSSTPPPLPPDLQLTYDQQRMVLRSLVAHQATPEQLDSALDAYLDLLLRIRHHVPLTEPTRARPLDLAQLRAQLTVAYPTGWTAVVYIECADDLLIVTLEPQAITITTTALDDALKRLLAESCSPHCRRFTYLDLSHRLHPSRQPWHGLRALAERLLPPAARARLTADSRLLIVPSSRLHGLPWAALRLDDAWLCERTIVQIVPTLGMWKTLSARQTAGREALLIGCSAFGDRAESLPGVAAELAIVAERYGGAVTCLQDTNATRSHVLALNADQQLGRYALIHVASHAQIVAVRGLLAHIKLWDDDLFYDEIGSLALDGVIVVLSTCEGDLGEVLPGEDVLSLGRAFLAAGARDVIASLWPVDDRLTGHVMRALYDSFAAGHDTSAAVSTVQRYLLSQANPTDPATDLASPLVWAGFHVLGAGTRIKRSDRPG